MAIVNGTEFEFIDLQPNSGGNTTRHMIRDAQARQDVAVIKGALTAEIQKGLTPALQTDGYYSLTGAFVTDAGRKYCVLSVEPSEKYRITTAISSTAIAGILFRNGEEVVSYLLRGSGSLEIITDYDAVVPANCDNMIVQCASSNRELAISQVYTYPNHAVLQIDTTRLGLGSNILAGKNGTLGTNWTGNAADGWTHTAGSNSSLSFFSADIEADAVYICEFDTTYSADEFLNVGIGDNYRILVYNGTNHITIPLKGSTTQNVFFTPHTNRNFTISNLSMRKIGGNTEYISQALNNVFTINHENNYGFWNILMGPNTAENAVGTTRSIIIGYAAMKALQGGHRNVAIGTFAMSQLTGGENNIAIGADSMLAVKRADDCIAIGKGTAYNGAQREDDIAIGHYALTGSASSSNSKRNVAIGKNAGWYCSGQDNTFLGYQAGYSCQNTNGNTIIGKNALGAATGNHNSCLGEQSGFTAGASNATAIGYNVKADKSNQVKIGNGNVTEVVFCGNKKINFNADGTVTWETVE